MRKVLGIVLYVFAGFFVYMVSLLSFVEETATEKLIMLLVFSVPVIVFIVVGLVVNRFNNWKKHTGIVLLSGAGVTAFVILTFVSYMMNDEFRKMMDAESLELFSAYVFGAVFTLSTVFIGIMLIRMNKNRVEQSPMDEDK